MNLIELIVVSFSFLVAGFFGQAFRNSMNGWWLALAIVAVFIATLAVTAWGIQLRAWIEARRRRRK